MPRTTRTAARQVHAVLAAAVSNPLLLEELRQRAGRGEDDTATFDLERIRLFAGLAVKVRQNDVRLSLPLTFKLLDRLKISIPLFAAYSKQAAALRQANKNMRSDKIESISCFMEGWLDPHVPEHALVRDILRHERALLACNGNRANSVPGHQDRHAASVTAAVRPESIPRPAPGLIHHEMSCDTLALDRMLRLPTGDLSAVRRGQFYYAYCWDSERGCVSTREIDELGDILINLAGGRRSVGRLVEILRQAGVTLSRAQLCDATQNLVNHGILILVDRPSRRTRGRSAIGSGR
jgi:hypothetical protein